MQLNKISNPYLYMVSLLLLWLPLSHAMGCRGDPNKFLCVTGKYTRKCIENQRVCDGRNDCEDKSDEWEWLCNQQCEFQDSWNNRTVKGFRCFQFSGFSAANATAAAPDHDNSYTHNSNENNNTLQKLNHQN